jgi:hypothetical protein
MYQFTTTTIINSALDSNGTTAKFAGSATALEVTRVGKFLNSNITSIHKRAYSAPVLEIAQVTVPTITAGLVARLDVDVRLSQQTDSEYANSYLYFKKPVVVEVIATGTATTDATALKNQINGLKDRYGFSYVTASTSGANVILTATNANQRFFSIKILKEANSTNSIIDPLYEDVSASTFSVTTKGKLGFGDDDWMQRKIMLQTAENVRYFGYNKEERPILGGNYTEYVLHYTTTKDHATGISGGVDYSKTTHVFYVANAQVAAWETELDKLTSKPYGLVIAAADVTLTTATNDTSQITATNAIGAVTYVSDQVTRATVGASTGLVTTAGVTATGEVVITATDSVGNTATLTFTIE